jgi:hypothetical protein
VALWVAWYNFGRVNIGSRNDSLHGGGNHYHDLDDAGLANGMTIELTRKHAVLFAVLLTIQTTGLWLTFSRVGGLPRIIWVYIFVMVPGSALLTTMIVMDLIQAVFHKKQNRQLH